MMKPRTFWSVVVATVALATAAVHAATVTIEPDNYANAIPGGPGVTFFTLRQNATHDGIAFGKVYAATGGAWTPTGQKVFGHSVLSPGELAYHWDNIGSPGGAWDCYTSQDCVSFKVLGAYFKEPVSTVRILTTMRGEQAMDPVDLWAFNASGERILRCRTYGIDQSIVNSGVLPPPVYVESGNVCGKVIEKKNCSGDPGNCDFVVEMRVQRRVGDIAFVWFGGLLWDNTHANVDAFTYTAY
jgi:hypothetical protein